MFTKGIQLKQHISCLEACKDTGEFCKYQPDCKIEEVGLQCPKLCGRCKDTTPTFLYLTFDDGPNEGTPNVLRALKVIQLNTNNTNGFNQIRI